MAFSRSLEIKTLQQMITMYCHAHHSTSRNELCADCSALFEYAGQRIDKCFYGDNKRCARNALSIAISRK